jgi:hypothetical protein
MPWDPVLKMRVRQQSAPSDGRVLAGLTKGSIVSDVAADSLALALPTSTDVRCMWAAFVRTSGPPSLWGDHAASHWGGVTWAESWKTYILVRVDRSGGPDKCAYAEETRRTVPGAAEMADQLLVDLLSKCRQEKLVSDGGLIGVPGPAPALKVTSYWRGRLGKMQGLCSALRPRALSVGSKSFAL